MKNNQDYQLIYKIGCIFEKEIKNQYGLINEFKKKQ